ncbi:MAG: ABC-2 family transporter protein [Halanaerobiales bacterium]|nr:ABC-2 family transporter protein [Halanaerobiales bacterium]
MKLYFQLQLANLKSRTMYPVNFFIGILSIFLVGAIPILNAWIIVEKFDNISGWSFGELILLISIWRVSFGLFSMFFGQVWNIDNIIRLGNLDRYLIRPASTLLQLFASNLGISGFGDLLAGICGFVIFGLSNYLSLSDWIIITMASICGTFIMVSIFLIVATFAFWVLKVNSLRSIISKFNHLFYPYPLSIYNVAIQILLTFIIPFAFVNFYPAQIFIDHKENLLFSFGNSIIYLSPVVCILFFSIAVLFWNFGLKYYTSTGS